jgi:hypothetical protein
MSGLSRLTRSTHPWFGEIGIGQSFWDFMLYGNIQTEADMRNWVMDILSRAEKGTDLPFAS